MIVRNMNHGVIKTIIAISIAFVFIAPGSAIIDKETDTGDNKTLSILCGDVDHNGIINIADPITLISIIFIYPQTNVNCTADANGDGFINISDAVYLIAFVYGYGPAPLGDCCDPPG